MCASEMSKNRQSVLWGQRDAVHASEQSKGRPIEHTPLMSDILVDLGGK